MTTEEAIKELREASDNEVRYGDTEHHYDEVMKRVEAFDMAIKALEQQPTDTKTYLKRREENYVEYNVEWFLKNWELELEILSGGKIKQTDADCISRKEMLKYQEYLHGKMSNEENHKLWEFIKQLPSVTPQPKIGQKWIPCTERLPEPNRLVLCYITTGTTKTYFLAWWNDIQNDWEEGIGGCRLLENDLGYEVIAWMPLMPYKAEREEEVSRTC